jgi:tight adherence protein C
MTVPLALLLAGVFASVLLLVGSGLWMFLHRLSPERRRLRDIVMPPEATAETGSPVRSGPHPAAVRVAALLPRSPMRHGEVRERLVAAGYRSAGAPVVFTAVQVATPIAAFLVTLATGGMDAAGLAFLLAAIGYLMPEVVLRRLMARRRREIRHGLPDVLDLLVLCLQSGCSLDQSMVKASDELALAHPALAEELLLVSREIRAGKPRGEAFRHFADRTGVDEVRSLVALLIQTDRYGTSVAQTLQVNSEMLRTARRQDAEERAARASVKLVFPLVFCLFPAFYIVALGPAILQFVRVFIETVAAP